jgi:peptide/nickel transport system permease protein
MVWAIATLAAVVVADPTRQGRAALVGVMTSDYFTASAARGAGPLRLMVVHGLRNAFAPVATRLSTELPLAVTACFVIERIYGLDGMGAVTLDAVARHDTRWLMAVALAGAVLAVLALIISDVAYASLDPRLRAALMRTRRRRR